MWTDFFTLSAKEFKRIRKNSAYWLSLIGFDQQASRIYTLYIVLFWLYWLFSMWVIVVEQVYQASQQIRPQDAAALLEAFPYLVFFAQAAYILYQIFDPPLKLSTSDLVYVAPSPISRRATVLFHFVRSLFLPVTVLSGLGALIILFFAWHARITPVEVIGVQAFVLSFLLLCMICAAGWALSLLRLSHRSITVQRILALAVPIVLLGLWLIPAVLLWPGYLLVAPIRSELRALDLALLGTALLATFLCLMVVARQVKMAAVIDGSQMYARIRRLGLWGPVIAADVIAQIHKKNRLAKLKGLRVRLPDRLGKQGMLTGRTYVALARLSPWLALRLIFSGALLPSIIILVIKIGGYNTLQTWLLILILLVQLRPVELTRFFRESLNEGFLRQFVRENNLIMFASEIALPLCLMSLGMFVAMAFQLEVGAFEFLVAWLLAIVLLVILGLCQAVENVRLPVVSRYGTMPSLHYEYTVVATGAVIIAAGVLMHSLGAIVIVSLSICAGLCLLLYHSK